MEETACVVNFTNCFFFFLFYSLIDSSFVTILMVVSYLDSDVRKIFLSVTSTKIKMHNEEPKPNMNPTADCIHCKHHMECENTSFSMPQTYWLKGQKSPSNTGSIYHYFACFVLSCVQVTYMNICQTQTSIVSDFVDFQIYSFLFCSFLIVPSANIFPNVMNARLLKKQVPILGLLMKKRPDECQVINHFSAAVNSPKGK